MKKNSLLTFIALMLIWLVLMSEISWYAVVSGIIGSLFCTFFTAKFIPLPPITDVRYFRLFRYLFVLIKEIYGQGFQVIKLIFVGAKPHLTTFKTDLESGLLKAILINSITLTPGSIPLSMNENDELHILYLGYTTDHDVVDDVHALCQTLDRNLKKTEKRKVSS